MKNSTILLLLAFTTLFISLPRATHAFVFSAHTEGGVTSQNQVNWGTSLHKPTIKERLSTFVFTKVLKVPKNAAMTSDGRKINGMALTGFITGVAGIFVATALLGTISIIFSAIGLVKVLKNPDIYKGKGFAIAGLVLGIVCLVIGIAALVAVA